MQYKYNNILSVQFLHEFFGAKQLEFVSVEPTEATLKLLKNNGFSINSKQNGIEIAYESNPLINRWTTPVYVLLKVCFNDPYWSNYTSLSSSEEGKVYVLNEKDTKGIITDVRQLDYSNSGSIELPHREEDVLTAINQNNQEEIRCNLTAITPEKKLLDVRFLDEGVYSIKEDGHLQFIFASIPSPDLLLQITLDPTQDAKEKQSLEYTLGTFEVYLYYYFPKKALDNYSDLAIVNGNDEVVFERADDVTVGTQLMGCFKSLEPIKFVNDIATVFRLKRDNKGKNKGGVTVIKQLPYPDRTNLYKRTESGEKAVEMYVNF